MFFAFVCQDREDALDLRQETRPAHLAWLKATSGVYCAGPLLDGDGKPCGSLLIVEHESLGKAEEWSREDPYAKAGLFASVSIREWKKVIGG